MKLCVTGCLGFIGYHFTKAALRQGWHIHGVDKITYAAVPERLDKLGIYKYFSFEKMDINELEDLSKYDYIVNFAAESHVDNSIKDYREFLHSNVSGIINILERVRDTDTTLVHISTDEVYGDIEEGYHSEKDILKPSNPYSASKAAADMMVLAWSRTHDVNYRIARPTNNYGPGQHPEKLIPAAIDCFYKGKTIGLHDKGAPIRNWLHVKDTAEAIVRIIKYGANNEIYNISANYEQANFVTVRKIYNTMASMVIVPKSFSDVIDTTATRKGQDVRYAITSDKLRGLGWVPRRQFDTEIKHIIQSYLDSLKKKCKEA